MRAVLALLVVLATAPVAAQDCPGDCTYDGQVKVAELILAVRVALGDLGVDSCFAADVNRDGAVGIDELVLAVSMLLNGCPAPSSPTTTVTLAVTPTATATSTELATATASATPTATPTIPPVGGAWVEAPLTVGQSTCSEEFTAVFAEMLAERVACPQQVELLDDTTADVTDCSSQTVRGQLDRDGTIHLVFPRSEGSAPPCTVTLDVSSVIAAGADPVVASYTFGLAFGGDGCPFDDCTIQASAPWTRPE